MNDTLETITQIKTLKELRLSDNALSGDLNPAIGNLTELEVLEVQGNKLALLPSEIIALVRLKVLNISNNQLSALPMAELCELSLTQLLASKNKLTGTLFSNGNAQMPRLQHLDVSINYLQSLSSGTLILPLLKELNVAFNRISSLPNMSSWTDLNNLLAEDNKITGLSEGFTDLHQLRTVDFTGNDFSKLDPRIGAMSGLESIKFAANPIRERKFLTMGTADLKRDLRARLGVDEPGTELD
jgi:Leucine-rich repeat (LRR) protein